jgi:hypothetical protein
MKIEEYKQKRKESQVGRKSPPDNKVHSVSFSIIPHDSVFLISASFPPLTSFAVSLNNAEQKNGVKN